MYASLAVIIASISLIAIGSTGAFFSDSETSSGNTFAAGTIDLKVDNESYYNLNKCANVGTLEVPVWKWQGSAGYPVPGTSCDTSFPLSDLDKGLLFFNFNDMKPDDEGEDTISLHVQNDAWACMDLSLTSNNDNSSTEPELATPDAPEDINNTWDGELAQNIQMFWWADDGDNVYEVGENPISDGIQTLYNLATSTPFSVALADPAHNVWTPQTPGPIPANETVYVAKGWCFGNLSLNPVAAGQGVNPSVNSGLLCDGTALNNLTQTDKATVDVAFRAVQARNNPNFSCGGTNTRTAKITVVKQIVNDNGGNNIVADYQLFVDNSVVITPVTSGVTTTVVPGVYSVTETGVAGYVASFSGDCDSEGGITLAAGDDKTCTITNNDLPGNITLIKNVINNNGGAKTANQFKLRIDGVLVPQLTSQGVTANSPHVINEDAMVGYTFVSITGSAKCPAVLGGVVSLDEGESITCTITNDDIGS